MRSTSAASERTPTKNRTCQRNGWKRWKQWGQSPASNSNKKLYHLSRRASLMSSDMWFGRSLWTIRWPWRINSTSSCCREETKTGCPKKSKTKLTKIFAGLFQVERNINPRSGWDSKSRRFFSCSISIGLMSATFKGWLTLSSYSLSSLERSRLSISFPIWSWLILSLRDCSPFRQTSYKYWESHSITCSFSTMKMLRWT